MLVKAWDVSACTCSTEVCHLDDFDSQLLPSLLGLASVYCAERASVVTTREQAMIVGNKPRSSRGRQDLRSELALGVVKVDFVEIRKAGHGVGFIANNIDTGSDSDSKLGGMGGSEEDGGRQATATTAKQTERKKKTKQRLGAAGTVSHRVHT